MSEETAAAASQALRPLTAARLAALLKAQGWHFVTGPDGELLARWGAEVFRFTVTGSNGAILNVLGLMEEPVAAPQLPRLREVLEDWHREHPWPTCFFVPAPDGAAHVGAAVALNCGPGVSDAQLLRQVEVSLSSSFDAFENVRLSLRQAL